MSLDEQRPAPADVRDAPTLRRWYWLRSELLEVARRIGVGTSGGKLELADRICAHFEQRPPAPSVVHANSRDVLPTDLTGEVVLQEGQRCTEQLRAWMRAQVGPAFSFDTPMREAVHAGGIKLRDLVARWHATRGRVLTEIGPQFELNRFSRDWHIDHPAGTHTQMLAEWAVHRNRPATPTQPVDSSRILRRSRWSQRLPAEVVLMRLAAHMITETVQVFWAE